MVIRLSWMGFQIWCNIVYISHSTWRDIHYHSLLWLHINNHPIYLQSHEITPLHGFFGWGFAENTQNTFQRSQLSPWSPLSAPAAPWITAGLRPTVPKSQIKFPWNKLRIEEFIKVPAKAWNVGFLDIGANHTWSPSLWGIPFRNGRVTFLFHPRDSDTVSEAEDSAPPIRRKPRFPAPSRAGRPCYETLASWNALRMIRKQGPFGKRRLTYHFLDHFGPPKPVYLLNPNIKLINQSSVPLTHTQSAGPRSRIHHVSNISGPNSGSP